MAAAAPGFTVPSAITSLSSREYGVEIYLSGAGNPMSCSSAGWFRISISAQNYQAIVSTILTAFSQQKQISVYANGCDTDGESLIVATKIN
jgi:hypothetical protein